MSKKALNVQDDSRRKGIQGNKSKSEIKCVCLNARSIIKKKTELNIRVDDIKPHIIERGSSAVECRTRNQVSPGSNPPLVPFRRLGIFVLSINAPVDSAV